MGIIGNNNSAKINDVQYVEGLKHNLLSISQLCDSGFEVIFKPSICEIKQSSSGKIIFTGSRHKNLYILFLDELPTESCFMSIDKDKWIWHRGVDLVRGLPKLSYDKDNICEVCIKGKHVKSSFHPINIISTNKPLELLHIDLFGQIQTASLSGKRYGFVIVDDFSRFTWVLFLKNKNDSFEAFKTFCKKVQNEKNSSIISVRSDHGGEFENSSF